MFFQDKKSNITQLWKQNYFTYHLALNYFKKKISRHSPCEIYETLNRHGKYMHCDQKLDPYMINNQFLDEPNWDDLDIETLPLYENAAKMENILNFKDIAKEGIEDATYNMHFMYDGHRRGYTLKKSAIVRPYIYTKYVLLKAYFHTPEHFEQSIIFKELIKQLTQVSQEELHYLDIAVFRPLKNVIFELSTLFTSHKNVFNLESYDDDLEALLSFYKYICLFNITTSYSSANNNVSIMYTCNQLFLDKKSPAFTLLYACFKTNDPFVFDYFDLSINRTLKKLCKSCFDANIYPYQYIAQEKTDGSLRTLLKSKLFNYNVESLEKVCRRYLAIYAQIVFAIFTAQKTYGYVNNALTSDNIMVKMFNGSLYYSVHEDELAHFDQIFPSEYFTKNRQGYIVLKVKVDTAICKITNHEQAAIRFAPAFSKLSRISSLENIFESKEYELTDYDFENFNNDLLKFFIDIYDEAFFQLLFKRHQRGLSSKAELQILTINEQVFYCKENQEDIFTVEENCEDDEECRRIFNKFGAYGFGDQPACEITTQRTPDALMKYFHSFSRPKTKLKPHKLYFRMV